MLIKGLDGYRDEMASRNFSKKFICGYQEIIQTQYRDILAFDSVMSTDNKKKSEVEFFKFVKKQH